MSLLSRFSKSAFWTQFLFGIVAVFALPSVAQSENVNECEISDQQVLNFAETVKKAKAKAEIEQCLFIQQAHQTQIIPTKQAVEICIFSAKLYRLPSFHTPPVRAGPMIAFQI